MKNIIKILIPLTVLILTILVIISIGKTGYTQLIHEVETDTEYQATLFAERANRILENADMLLRLTSVSLSGIKTRDNSIPPALERQTRNELLLSPEIDFLAIITPDMQILWKSINAPDYGHSIYSSAADMHIKKGLKFNIAVSAFDAGDPDTIILSRTAVSESTVTAIIVIAVKASKLLPFQNDPYFQNTFYLGLTDSNFKTLADSGKAVSGDSGNLYSETANEVTGGLKLEHGKTWVSARIQTRSFPFYAIAYNRFDSEIKEVRNRILAVSLIIFTLYILIILTSLYIHQQRKKKHLQKVNSDLNELNKQRELLIKEVHHRVKNNLSMISSIIGLIIQNEGPYTEQTLESLSLRIDAISDIHERLYNSGSLNDIPLEDYINELVSNTLSAICCFEVELKIDIDPVTVSDKKAGYLGILLTEILTNAVKYGLKPESTLFVEGKTSGEKYTIVVENNGNPFTGKTKGLGSLLIEAMTAQLGAETLLDTSEATRYTITFPINNSPLP